MVALLKSERTLANFVPDLRSRGCRKNEGTDWKSLLLWIDYTFHLEPPDPILFFEIFLRQPCQFFRCRMVVLEQGLVFMLTEGTERNFIRSSTGFCIFINWFSLRKRVQGCSIFSSYWWRTQPHKCSPEAEVRLWSIDPFRSQLNPWVGKSLILMHWFTILAVDLFRFPGWLYFKRKLNVSVEAQLTWNSVHSSWSMAINLVLMGASERDVSWNTTHYLFSWSTFGNRVTRELSSRRWLGLVT